MCVYVCMYVCTYVRMYVYVWSQRGCDEDARIGAVCKVSGLKGGGLNRPTFQEVGPMEDSGLSVEMFVFGGAPLLNTGKCLIVLLD